MNQLNKMEQIKQKSKLCKQLFVGISISMLIIFITIYLPMLGLLMAMILPMPILYFRLKLGRKPGLVIMLTVFIITLAVTTGSSNGVSSGIVAREISRDIISVLSIDMLFYGALLLTGFFLGEFLEMRVAIEKSVIYTVSSTLLICGGGFFLYATGTGEAILPLVSRYVSDNIKFTLNLYESMGISSENLQFISDSIEIIEYLLIRMIPCLVTIMLVFITWINILFIKKILARKGIYLAEMQNLNQWKAPEQLVWGVIFLGMLMFIPENYIKIVVLNAVVIIMPVYFFQGIAILSFIFEKKNFPTLLKLSIYSIIAIQQILILVIIGLGFFDTWMNFRKIGIINDSEG